MIKYLPLTVLLKWRPHCLPYPSRFKSERIYEENFGEKFKKQSPISKGLMGKGNEFSIVNSNAAVKLFWLHNSRAAPVSGEKCLWQKRTGHWKIEWLKWLIRAEQGRNKVIRVSRQQQQKVMSPGMSNGDGVRKRLPAHTSIYSWHCVTKK